jgi:ABC-type glycerol-3-phosphate transport system permease component
MVRRRGMDVIRTKASRAVGQFLIYAVITLGSIAMAFPLAWTVSTSLKTPQQLVATRIQLIPNPVAWENYIHLFRTTPILLHFRNTLTLVSIAELSSLVLCSLVAYAFARIPFPGRDVAFALLLSSMMLPGAVTLIPWFVMFDRLGWINTFLPLVVPRFLAHNPFYIFLMRQFFLGIPQDLSDAAQIDGCSELGTWWRIFMPNSRPVLATVAVFALKWIWNDFLHPLVYLGGNRELWTLAIGLSSLKGMEGEVSTHYLMAYSVLTIIPMVVAFAFAQEYIVKGVAFTGIKG